MNRRHLLKTISLAGSLAMLPRLGAVVQPSKATLPTHRTGDISTTLLIDSSGKTSASRLIGATEAMLRQTLPGGTFNSVVQAFLVCTPQKKLLVDTGLGLKLHDNLQKCGLHANEVDAVLITHMHGDHIGGLLCDGSPAFPKATLFLPKVELDYWAARGGTSGDPARAIASAYAKRLHLFKASPLEALDAKPGASPSLLEGVLAIAAPGHTPGHTLFLLESKGERLLIWGDLMHAMEIQMPYPQVAITYDVDSDKAVKTRKHVLARIAGSDTTVTGMHNTLHAFGRVILAGKETYALEPATRT